MFVQLPFVSVKPNYFTTYLHRDVTDDHRYGRPKQNLMPIETKTHGIMSNKANGRVRLAIDWMLHLAKDKPLPQNKVTSNFTFKVNFITLTLCSKQKHSDNEIKAVLLNQFLTELRTKFKCSNYLWRAESQRNGNIHFHIVTDVFVPWRTLRSDWNRIQEKLGYVSAYAAKTGHYDPNSTDVHSINRIKNLSGYLAKYCSKNSKGYVVMLSKASAIPFKPQFWLNYQHPKLAPKATFYRQVRGKLWGLSHSLSKFKTARKEVSGVLEKECEWLRNTFKDKIRYTKQACMYFFDVSELLRLKCLTLANLFNSYKESILNPPTPEPVIIRETIIEKVVPFVFKQFSLSLS